MPCEVVTIGNGQQVFRGFEHLDANYIYCPNQFFEVCLRYHSRGVVRLVAYMLRKTLGYLDKTGSPVRQDIRISYLELSRHAGISTRAIPNALRDAESAGFIRCVTSGLANGRGQRGRAAQYRLRWSGEDDDYTNDPQQFRGFYAGEGHRTPIPNGFFDVVVHQETLAMAKVVGTVLRHTVGYQNQFGGRRPDAPLAYSYIQRFANINDRTTLSKTLKVAEQKGYIGCISKGRFDPNAGRQSCAARYAVKWLEEAMNDVKTAETRPERSSPSRHGKIPTGNVAESRPAEDGKIPTGRKTISKTSYKQQNVVAKSHEGYALLIEEGIDKKTARRLARSASLDEIRRQVQWIDFRSPQNRPAMLRKAIEQDWREPDGFAEHRRQQRARRREERENAERAAREAAIADQKLKGAKRRSRLLACWKQQSLDDRQRYRQMAARQAASDIERRLIHKSDLNSPSREILEVMALAIADRVGESS